MSRAGDRAVAQLGDAAGLACDLLFGPELRAKLTKVALESQRSGAPETVIEPHPSDVVVEAKAVDVCADCDGEGELKNIRGRLVPCGGCRGSGRAK